MHLHGFIAYKKFLCNLYTCTPFCQQLQNFIFSPGKLYISNYFHKRVIGLIEYLPQLLPTCQKISSSHCCNVFSLHINYKKETWNSESRIAACIFKYSLNNNSRQFPIWGYYYLFSLLSGA